MMIFMHIILHRGPRPAAAKTVRQASGNRQVRKGPPPHGENPLKKIRIYYTILQYQLPYPAAGAWRLRRKATGPAMPPGVIRARLSDTYRSHETPHRPQPNGSQPVLLPAITAGRHASGKPAGLKLANGREAGPQLYTTKISTIKLNMQLYEAFLHTPQLISQ